MTDPALWIWHQLMFGIGSSRSHVMMEYFDTPASILEGIKKRGQVVTMLREKELLGWEVALRKAEEIKRRTLNKGCEIITPDHFLYPPLLQNIHSKPAALYVKGDLSCLQGCLVIAIVGTRAFTEYGRDAGRKLAGELAATRVVVVSGLAKGIVSICHTAALKAGGKSIGILGCGLDIDYPKGSAQLKRNLCENGAVLSEYPLGTEPQPSNFVRRNRLISGMSDGTLVVEADLKSGSLITATHALEQNRELFAIPGSIFSVREQGTHKLIREGAKLTESAHDVLEEFAHRSYPNLRPELLPTLPIPENPARPEAAEEADPIAPIQPAREASAAPPPLPPDLAPAAHEIFALMQPAPQSVEALATGCTLALPEIQTALTQLEIYGLIIGHPGRRFSLR